MMSSHIPTLARGGGEGGVGISIDKYISAGCTGAGTLSHAKIYQPESVFGAGYRKESFCVLSQANIALANIYIGLN